VFFFGAAEKFLTRLDLWLCVIHIHERLVLAGEWGRELRHACRENFALFILLMAGLFIVGDHLCGSPSR
jgi:hypothetical protein